MEKYLSNKVAPRLYDGWLLGHRTQNKGDILLTRTPDFDCFLFVVSGEVSFYEDETLITVKDGQYYIQKAGTYQVGIPQKDHAEYMYIHFYADYCTADEFGYLNIKGTFDKKIIENYFFMVMATKEDKITSTYYFYKLLSELKFENSKQNKKTNVDEICDYIESHVAEINGITDLCRKFNYHRNHITQLFKSQLGITPHEYIKEQKIIFAKNLLLTSSLSIDAVAEKCGYDNVSTFFRQFKTSVKMTPKKYRDKHSKN